MVEPCTDRQGNERGPASEARTAVEVGALFRARRKSLGLTQKEAAARGSVVVTTWVKLEAGRHVSPATWTSAAMALDWPASARAALAAGADPSDIAEEQAGRLPRGLAVEEIERVLHRTDLGPDAIELGMAVVRRLMEL